MNKKLQKISAICLLGTMLLYSLPVAAFTKDETVYSNAKANGEKYKSVVTTHLENSEEEEVLRDLTDLLNIENTNGDEKYEQKGDTLIWNANKRDIYYKGETDKKLPIEISVKYELDGEKISPDEIAGKTGEVKVIIEFTNNEEHQIWINGRYETLYTPFVVAVGTYINNDNNKKIEIVNGKLIDDGTKTFAVGLVFPGLQDSLSIKKSLIEIPETIEITMESENFEMNNIVNYVTPLKFEDTDVDVFNDLNNLYAQVDKLQSASQMIQNGAETLAGGTATYYEKSQEFNQAIGKFSNGISSANSSYSTLNSGIAAIDSGAKQVQAGSKQVSDGATNLNNGVTTMKEQVGASATEIPKLTTGASQVADGLGQLYEGIEAAATAENPEETQNLTGLVTVEKKQAGTLRAYNQSLETAKSQLEAINTEEMDTEAITAIQTAIGTLDAQIKANTSIAGTLDTNADSYVALVSGIGETTKQQLRGLATNVDTLRNGAKQVSDGTNKVASNMSTLTNGLNTLSEGTKQLANGASDLYSGTRGLSAGATQAKNGSAQMKSGLDQLDSSAKQILAADTQLTEGAKTIQEGAQQLASGIKEFNETGINKICDYINSDIRTIGDRAQRLIDLAEDYNTFTKASAETESKVKFITIIDSIKQTDNENQSKEKIEEKTSE